MKNEITKEKSSHKKRKAPVILIIIMIIAACAFCFAGYKLVSIWLSYNASDTSYDNIRAVLQQSSGSSSSSSVPSSGSSSTEDADTSTDEQYDYNDTLPVEYESAYDEGLTWNLSALKAINSDVIGYIKARGDGNIVDYPIVQGTDNDYYLVHMVDCTYNPAGSIFMDYDIRNSFSAPYSIIYGHNMAYGSRMFGYLKQYENDPSYYAGHTEYDIYAGNEHYVYKVFAIYKATTDGLTYTSPLPFSYESMTVEEREAQLKEIASFALSQSQFNTGYTVDDVNYATHLIALSTCYGDYSDPNRYIVMLIRDRIVIPG